MCLAPFELFIIASCWFRQTAGPNLPCYVKSSACISHSKFSEASSSCSIDDRIVHVCDMHDDDSFHWKKINLEGQTNSARNDIPYPDSGPRQVGHLLSISFLHSIFPHDVLYFGHKLEISVTAFGRNNLQRDVIILLCD